MRMNLEANKEYFGKFCKICERETKWQDNIEEAENDLINKIENYQEDEQ